MQKFKIPLQVKKRNVLKLVVHNNDNNKNLYSSKVLTRLLVEFCYNTLGISKIATLLQYTKDLELHHRKTFTVKFSVRVDRFLLFYEFLVKV